MKQFLLFLLFPLYVFAFFSGNPASPELPEDGILSSKEFWLGLKGSYQGQWSWQSLTRKNNQGLLTTNVEGYRTLANLGVITFNFVDLLEVYSSLGTLWQSLTLRAEDDFLLKGSSSAGFFWGGGAKLVLFHWKAIVCGLDAKYGRSKDGFSYLLQNGVPISTQSTSIKNSTWQVAVSLAREIGIFVPYVGLKYQFTKVNCHGKVFETLDKEFNNTHTVGLNFGVSFSREYLFAMTLELATIAERATSLAFDFRF